MEVLKFCYEHWILTSWFIILIGIQLPTIKWVKTDETDNKEDKENDKKI